MYLQRGLPASMKTLPLQKKKQQSKHAENGKQSPHKHHKHCSSAENFQTNDFVITIFIIVSQDPTMIGHLASSNITVKSLFGFMTWHHFESVCFI